MFIIVQIKKRKTFYSFTFSFSTFFCEFAFVPQTETDPLEIPHKNEN